MKRQSVETIVLQRVGFLLLGALVAVGVWIVILIVFDVIPLVGKQPWQVWAWLFTEEDAADNRAIILENLVLTVRDSGIGYVIGLGFSFGIAVVFVLSEAIEQTFIPPIMLARSVPLLVLTPLITLVFGINVIGVSAVVTIVVFFPALVNIVFGLRSVNPQLVDLVRAHGGSNWTVLRKVAMPSALPALFASARLAVPMAVTGAMIGEWLATGEGLGGAIARAAGAFDFNQMWASAVTVAAMTMVGYTLVAIVDALVTRRFGALDED